MAGMCSYNYTCHCSYNVRGFSDGLVNTMKAALILPSVATPRYLRSMTETTEPSYDKPRQMRIPDSEWLPFDEAAATKGLKRAAVVRQFIRWYLHRPGATMPKRPDIGPWSTPGGADA